MASVQQVGARAATARRDVRARRRRRALSAIPALVRRRARARDARRRQDGAARYRLSRRQGALHDRQRQPSRRESIVVTLKRRPVPAPARRVALPRARARTRARSSSSSPTSSRRHVLERVVGTVFSHIANTFIDAFVRRAERVHVTRGDERHRGVATPGVQDVVSLDARRGRDGRRRHRAIGARADATRSTSRELAFAIYGRARAAARAARRRRPGRAHAPAHRRSEGGPPARAPRQRPCRRPRRKSSDSAEIIGLPAPGPIRDNAAPCSRRRPLSHARRWPRPRWSRRSRSRPSPPRPTTRPC